MGDACSDLRYLALVLSEEGGGLTQAWQLLRSCGSCCGCLRLPMGEASGRKRLLDALELCVLHPEALLPNFQGADSRHAGHGTVLQVLDQF